jgi:hypothetical protein
MRYSQASFKAGTGEHLHPARGGIRFGALSKPTRGFGSHPGEEDRERANYSIVTVVGVKKY